MVKVVFIGCGAALEHLYRDPLKMMERRGWLRLVGVVDPDERRQRVAVSWFRHAKAFPDLVTAFGALGQLDLAIIASPPVFHSSHAAIAFEHNCHVLCEKPMTHTVSAAEDMVDIARRGKRLLAVGMLRRIYPAIAFAKTWIREQAEFSPLAFVYREGSVFDWPIASPLQFRRKTGGGGVLIDKGIHCLDTLVHTFGRGQVLRHADDASIGDGVEANSAVELQFATGKGFLQVSWDVPLNNGFHIAGSTEEIWLPMSPIDTVWKRSKAKGSVWKTVEVKACWPDDLAPNRPKVCKPRNFSACVRLQLVSVLRSIHLGEPPIASGGDGLEVMRLVMTAYDNAMPLNQPWLPPNEQRASRESHWRAGGNANGFQQCAEEVSISQVSKSANV